MKVQDKRKLNNLKVEVGDLILAEDRKYYVFAHDESEKYEYLMIDVLTYKVVNGFHKHTFDSFEIGSELEDAGTIVEIHKNKDLAINIGN